MIRVPYLFEGEARSEKLFVVLCHKDSFVVCIKATSKTAIFRNNPSMRKGCVWYSAGQVPCFPLDTVIEPDNQFAIPYEVLRRAERDGILQGAAIRNSATLAPRQRARILAIL